jgi:hypothetical protein
MSPNEVFLTTEGVAELLHLSTGYVKQIWPKFTKYNVNPIRVNGNCHLLFKKSEIMRMLENWQVIQK